MYRCIHYNNVSDSLSHVEDEEYTFADGIQTSSSIMTPYADIPMSVSLPPSLFKQINDTDTNSTGLVFTVYQKLALFPVSRKASSNSMVDTITEVDTNIIAAIVGRNIAFENLQDPITIILQLESQNNVY